MSRRKNLSLKPLTLQSQSAAAPAKSKRPALRLLTVQSRAQTPKATAATPSSLVVSRGNPSQASYTRELTLKERHGHLKADRAAAKKSKPGIPQYIHHYAKPTICLKENINEYFELSDTNLGRGAFGEVKTAKPTAKGYRLIMNRGYIGNKDGLVAVKKMTANGYMRELIAREIKLLAQTMDFKYSAKYYGCFQPLAADDNEIYIVMEYIKGKSLDKVIGKGVDLGLERKRSILMDIAKAIAELHTNNIAHRDIKPANIMLANDGRVKLLDYGISCDDFSKRSHCNKVVGTAIYRDTSDEFGNTVRIYGLKKALYKADWWAFGLLAYELYTDKEITGIKEYEIEDDIDEKIQSLYRNIIKDDDHLAKYLYALIKKTTGIRMTVSHEDGRHRCETDECVLDFLKSN